MIMARWFIKQFLHCRPGLQTELGNLHSAAIQHCCRRNRRDGTILQRTKITSHDSPENWMSDIWSTVHVWKLLQCCHTQPHTIPSCYNSQPQVHRLVHKP
jgi:hypothetical protein